MTDLFNYLKLFVAKHTCFIVVYLSMHSKKKKSIIHCNAILEICGCVYIYTGLYGMCVLERLECIQEIMMNRINSKEYKNNEKNKISVFFKGLFYCFLLCLLWRQWIWVRADPIHWFNPGQHSSKCLEKNACFHNKKDTVY